MSYLTRLTNELFIDFEDISLIAAGEQTESHHDWQANTYYKTITIKFKDGNTEVLKFRKHDEDSAIKYENVLERINKAFDKL